MGPFVIAVDLGGTKVASALVDAAASVLPGSAARRPTGRAIDDAGLRSAIAATLGDTIRSLPPGAMVSGVGIGAAGPVDFPTRSISPLNLPTIRGFPVVEVVEAALSARGIDIDGRIALGHDGGCLALAEAWIGANRGAHTSMALVVSTGIGGGIVSEGRLLRGATGNAGHLGQTILALDGTTLESIASGPSSVRWATGEGWTGATGEDLAADAAAGGTIARRAIERSARALGVALSSACALVDLDSIAIGGGFSHAADDYLDLVREAFEHAAPLEHLARVRIRASSLDVSGPLIGAAALLLAPGTAIPTGP